MTSIYSSSTSSNSSTSSANLLRISGMASGIDTDSVVKSMVSSYQTKIDKENQAKQTLQWKQEAYRDIIKDIKGLQDYFDPLSDKYLLSGKSFNINSTVSDETSIVSATASSSAKAGTYNMKVSQVASQAKIEGESKNSLFKVPVEGSEWIGAEISIDSNTISLAGITDSNSDGTVLDEIVTKINDSKSTTKVSAQIVNDGTYNYIKFTNEDTTNNIEVSVVASDTTTSLFSDTINAGSSSSYKEDGSKLWSGATLAFNLNNIAVDPPLELDDTITDTNSNGTNLDEVVSNINKQIASNDDLKGKLSASYVNDGTSSYIKFTKIGTDDIKLTGITSGLGTSLDISNISSINSGISSTSKLMSDLSFSSGEISFTVNDVDVSVDIDSSSTVQDLMDAVNSATSGAVTMSIDDTTGKISFQSKSYGSASSIKITSDTDTMGKLGLTGTANNGTITTTATGTDAIVAIKAPGQSTATTTTQSSNNFTLNGVTYNLVGVNDTTNPDTNITVTSDSDTVVDNIKKFIEDYNSVIDTINTKLTEKKDSDYPPLTDAQKEEMSDDQITAWETKAKVGVLRNDDLLSSLMSQLRGIFSSPVYSSYDSSSTNTAVSLSFGQYGTNAIGIDTSSDYTEGGKLVLKDETKLKDAIKNNLDDFKKLFIGTTDNDSLKSTESYIGSKNYMEDGFFTRMNSILRDYVAAPGLGEDGTYTLSGSMNIFVNKQYDYSAIGSGGKNTLPDQLYSRTLSISKLTTQMSDAETRYYNKFTALETAMNALNSQQSALSSMLGS